MIGALIILAVTVAIGILLWAWERFRSQRHGHTLHHHNAPSPQTDNSPTQQPNNSTTPQLNNSEICCGLHSICEKTGQINEPPVYYDDEELDRFAGRPADEYNDEETEEFRDVLLTLQPSDAPGWTVSLEKRRISLPSVLLPELELLLSES